MSLKQDSDRHTQRAASTGCLRVVPEQRVEHSLSLFGQGRRPIAFASKLADLALLVITTTSSATIDCVRERVPAIRIPCRSEADSSVADS